MQAGYNWQFGCTVFGIEIDGSWADLDSTRTHTPTAGPGTVLTLHNKLEWYGTLRTRTGVVVDSLLLYVTGGFAYANIRHDWRIDDTSAVPALIEQFSANKERWGWVAGVGAEWAFTPNLSIKTEALYVRFSEVSTTVFSPNGAQNVSFDNQDSMWIGRIGLNYRFGGNPL